MLRHVYRAGLIANLFSPGDLLNQDILSNATETEQKANLASIKEETGWERIQRMFEIDEFGNLSNELTTISHVGAMSLFVGAIYGGVMYSRIAYMDFIKNNQATAFNNHFEAKKKLQDHVTKSFGRGAWKWSWRLALFSTSFVGISTTISVYRGESGISEHVVAGLISGTLYKFNLGPRGWLVGGALGSALGLIAGGVTVAILKMTGMSMEEVRYWQYHWQKARTDYINKGIAEYLEKEELTVITDHNKKLGEAGKSLDNLQK